MRYSPVCGKSDQMEFVDFNDPETVRLRRSSCKLRRTGNPKGTDSKFYDTAIRNSFASKAYGSNLLWIESGFMIVLLFWQKDQNHLPKRWLARSLKTQEILTKRWASPNGLWAVFAGFLCVFKFTGSTAPRLGGLTRCIERTFCAEINIFWRLRAGSKGTDNTLNLTLYFAS
jgi:hypothetical protein